VSFVNSGDSDADISSVQLVGTDAAHFAISGESADQCSHTMLMADATNQCQLLLSHDLGDYQAQLEFTINGQDPQYVDVYGMSPLNGPDIELVNPDQAYGPSGSVALVNEGDVDAQISDIQLVGADAGHFSMSDPNGCVTASLLANSDNNCQISMAHDSGNYHAQLEFTIAGQDPEAIDIYGGAAPHTAITSGPSGPTDQTTASFGFSSEPGSSFECRWDAGSWAPCSSPTSKSGLDNGNHSFQVRATDASGFGDPDPAERSWLVDAPGDGPPCASPSQPESSEAVQTLEENAPEIIAASDAAPYSGQTIDPSLDQNSDAANTLQTDGSLANAAVPCNLAHGLRMETGWGTLALSPLDVSADATDAAVVHGDSAVFADTAPSADSVIRPTAQGLAAYTQIRSAAAPQTYSWRVSMSGGVLLNRLDDGSLAILADPTPMSGPTESSDDGGPVAGDPAGQDILADASQIPITDELPPPTAADPGSSPDPAQGAQASEASAPQVADQLASAADSLTSASAQLGDGEYLLAVIDAPWAVDANGQSVPVSLGFDGTTVTMTVDHHSGNYAYPIIADPDLKDCIHRPSPCGNYHSNEAAAYAYKFRVHPNLSYPVFHDDCTNYVSQALHAGHMNFMGEWKHEDGDWWAWREDWTSTWSLAIAEHNHLRHFGLARAIHEGQDNWRVGDIVFFKWEKGPGSDQLSHVDFVDAVAYDGDNAIPYFLQHSRNYGEPISYPEFRRRVRHSDRRGIAHVAHLRPMHTKANIPG
jgi:putative amidase-like protein